MGGIFDKKGFILTHSYQEPKGEYLSFFGNALWRSVRFSGWDC